MNKKGFTLIELLGVLVIFSVIILIAIPTVNTSIKKNKEKNTKNVESSIIKSVEIYASSNKDNIKYNSFIKGECAINVNDLKTIKPNLFSDYEKELIDENKYVYYDTNTKNFILKDNNNSLEDCFN